MTDKSALRREKLGERRRLSADSVETLSKNIFNKLIATEQYRLAEDICLYMPINNEVDVRFIMSDALACGKRVWLPRILDGQMDFYFYDENTPLITGFYDIKEPDTDRVLTPGETTLVVMPGSAFSRNGNRIGYGGGYYDRYLSNNPCCKTLAVCYDFQIVDYIEDTEYDIKPQLIISN